MIIGRFHLDNEEFKRRPEMSQTIQPYDCEFFGSRPVIKAILNETHNRLPVWFVDHHTIRQLLKKCEYYRTPSLRFRSMVDDFFSGMRLVTDLARRYFAIYPGTKWCGAGDVAENYNDLGLDADLDKCCRDHDHCPDLIHAGEYAVKYNLTNDSYITKSSCDCDKQLANCLTRVGELNSSGRRVGELFFNVFRFDCFKHEHPILECIKYGGIPGYRRCEEYALDSSQERIYQFFDAKPF